MADFDVNGRRLLAGLVAAMQDHRLVRLTRAFETSHIRGYVLEIRPEWFVMALVSDRLWLDGYECFRIKDLQTLEHDPYTNFAETALRLRHEVRPDRSPVNVTSLETLLRSAAAAFPLVTVHTEETYPDACWIGSVLSVDQETVVLHEISPDASWDSASTAFRLGDITRVNFGGDYEDALFIVGGDARPIVDWSVP